MNTSNREQRREVIKKERRSLSSNAFYSLFERKRIVNFTFCK
jgi:hypothetical protein